MPRSLWHISPQESELRLSNCEPGQPDVEEVVSLYSLVSKGTEKLVALGLVDEQYHTQMAVPYMEGSFSLPIKYGYSLVGKTEDSRLVHLLHPHQDRVRVSRQALFYLPEDVNPQRMALLSNMETVINACWDAEHFSDCWALKSSPVIVCGFGAIGSLLAITLRKLGFSQVLIKESDSVRLNMATSLGFQTLSEQGAPESSLLFHSSSTATGLQWCIEQARLEGTIIELSWYGKRTCELQLGGDFHFKRLRLISSQVSNIPGHKTDESYHSRKALAVHLLKDNVYQLLMDEPVPFSQAPAFFTQLRANRDISPLQTTFSYNES